MSSIPAKLGHRLEEARKALHLTAADLAAKLSITPEWYSKIVNGKVAGSQDIALRLDNFLREHSLAPSSIQALEPDSMSVQEARASGDPAEKLREMIRLRMDVLLESAQHDVSRLGWISEQMREHLTPPKSWKLPLRDEVVRVNLPSQKIQRPNPSRHSQSA